MDVTFAEPKWLEPIRNTVFEFEKFAEKNSRINLELKLNKLKTFDNFTNEIKKMFQIKKDIKEAKKFFGLWKNYNFMHRFSLPLLPF